MRSSRKYLDESYKTLLQMKPIQQPEIKQEENADHSAVPVDEASAYDKQKKTLNILLLFASRKYPQKTKRISEKNSYKSSRNRLLRFLNLSPEYENAMRESTKTKYKF